MILLCNFCNLNYKIKQKDNMYKLLLIDGYIRYFEENDNYYYYDCFYHYQIGCISIKS